MKKIFLIVCLLLLPATTWAVDGYKNLKFGIKKEAVKKSKLCHFEEIPPDDGDVMETLGCQDYKFNGVTTIAWAYFIDGKFLRFAFGVPSEHFVTTLEALGEKYGRASSGSTKEALLAVERYPNRNASLSFDKDTITLTYDSDENSNLRATVVYSSPDYMRLYKKKNKAGMKDSL